VCSSWDVEVEGGLRMAGWLGGAGPRAPPPSVPACHLPTCLIQPAMLLPASMLASLTTHLGLLYHRRSSELSSLARWRGSRISRTEMGEAAEAPPPPPLLLASLPGLLLLAPAARGARHR